MTTPLLVERALSLIPDLEEFLPLTEALIGVSESDREKRWAGSGALQALGKRVVDPARLEELLPRVMNGAQERLQRLFSLVLAAIRAQQSGEPHEAVYRLVEAGEMEEASRRPEKAERLYGLALEIAETLRDRRPQILALRRQARAARGVGQLDRAWTLYERSYQLASDEVDLAGQVVACQGLGNVSADRGQRDRARGWYERGLRLTRGLESPELEWPLYSNLSMLTRQEGDLGAAEAFLEQARHAIEAVDGQAARFFWYNNLGLLLAARGDHAGAEGTYREGLALGPEPFPELTLRVNLGHALLAQGRLLEAEEEARRSEELAIVARLVPDLVDVYDLLGGIARQQANEEGFVFYEQALELCRMLELPRKSLAAVYHGYGRLQLACGRVEEGRGYLDLARETYEELGLLAELAKVVRDLDASYAAGAVAEGGAGAVPR